MGIFGRREQAQPASPTAYEPVIDMRTARPAVFALAHSMSSNDAQVRAAIANLARLSDRPPPMGILAMNRESVHLQRVLERPWIWLAAVMRQAGESGDHHLVMAALLWALHWTTILVPKIGADNWAAFAELELNPVPPHCKKEILALGLASARQLPEDFVIAGDKTGEMRAGDLARLAGNLLAP